MIRKIRTLEVAVSLNLLLLANAPSTFAATATKQSTGTDLTGATAGVWSGGTGANGSPGSADTATWASTSLGQSLTLGSSATWLGLTVNGAATAIDISGAGTLSLGTTASQVTVFTIASGGQNVTFNNPVIGLTTTSHSGSGAIFSVASGKTLTFNNAINMSGNSGGVLQFTGGGTVYLNGTDGFNSGNYMTIGGCTVQVSSMANAFGSLGLIQLASSSGNGTIVYTGTGETYAGAITYPTSSTGKSQIIDQSGSGTLKFSANITANGTGFHTLQIQGSTSGVGEISGAIQQSGANAVNVIKTGSGTWTLSGNSSAGFASGLSLNQGQLNINNANALGTTAGTFTISGSAGSVSIDNTSGSAFTLANYPQAWNADYTFVGSSDLNLGSGAVAMNASRQVTVSSHNLTVGGIISGSTFGITKAGSGTLTLNGANSYTGATTVRNGTLTVGGSLASGSAVEVSAADGNANLAGAGTVNGTVTLDASGSYNAGINLQNSLAGTLTLANGLVLNGGNVLNFDVAGASTSDKIAVTGAVTLPSSGTVTVNLNNIGVSVAATFKLISATSGTMDYTKFNLVTAAPTGYTWQLQNDADGHSLDLVISSSAPATAYWNGAVSANWSAADSGSSYNWVTTAAGGTSTGGKPGIGTAVIFSDNSPVLHNSTLDAAFEIGSLEFNDASGTTISDSGSHALTLDGWLTVDSGAGTVSVNVGSYVLGGSGATIANNSSSGLNISSPISGANTLTVNGSGSGTTTLSGVNSHSGTAVQNGTLTLSGSGTLGGSSATVNVSGGTLDLATKTPTVGAVTVSGGTVQNGALTGTSYALQAGTVSAALNGSGVALTKTTAGTATLSGNNGYTGGTTISAGTLTISGSGTLGGGSYAGTIGDSGTFNYGSSVNQTLSGVISGSGALTMSGSGTLTLSGPNTYSGGTSINGGIVKAGVAQNGSTSGPLGASGSISFSGGTLQFSSASAGWDPSARIAAGTSTSAVKLDLNGQGTSSSQIPFGTALTASQSGGLVISDTVGNGTVYLSSFGGNNYVGDTIINGGEVQFAADGSFGTGTLTINGGSLVPRAGTRTLANAVVVGGNFAANQSSLGIGANSIILSGTVDLGVVTRTITIPQNSLTCANVVSDGGLIKAGSGTLTLSGANTYAGGITLNAGQLNINSSTALGTSGGTFTIAGASTIDNTSGGPITLANNNPQAWNADFTNAGSANLNLGSGAVTMGASRQVTVRSSTLTVGGIIGGSSYGLTKAGNGTLAFSGANTYTGNTTISAGTLALGVGGSLASPNISVATNATFDVSALSSYALNGSGTLTIGVDKTSGTRTQGQLVLGSKALTYNGDLTVNKTGSDTLAAGDSFTLVSSSGTYAGWVNSVSLPSLSSGLSWDTNDLATSGVLDVYSFTTTPLTVAMLSNTVATISAAKLANHASSSKATPAAIAASSPAQGLASISAGALTYTPNADYSGPDAFTVTFADGHNSQTMTVSVTVNTAIAGPTLSGVDNGSGHYKITTSGLPSQIYDVQEQTTDSNVTGPWITIDSVTAAANGLVSWEDGERIDAHQARTYRLAQH